jgi:hypothetical protein
MAAVGDAVADSGHGALEATDRTVDCRAADGARRRSRRIGCPGYTRAVPRTMSIMHFLPSRFTSRIPAGNQSGYPGTNSINLRNFGCARIPDCRCAARLGDYTRIVAVIGSRGGVPLVVGPPTARAVARLSVPRRPLLYRTPADL